MKSDPMQMFRDRINDRAGANVFGRLEFAGRLLAQGDLEDARREIRDVVRFLKGI